MTQIERGTDLHVRRQISDLCVFVLDRVIADTAITNTVTETTLYTKTVDHSDINGKVLRLTLAGTYLNNTGATSTPTLRIKFGSTTIVSPNTLAYATSASLRQWRIAFELTSRTTATQELTGIDWWTSASGAISSPSQAQSAMYEGTAAETTSGTGTKALTVTWQHDAASANLTITLKTAVLERL